MTNSVLRPLAATVLIAVTLYYTNELLTRAYTIRLNAIQTFGYIIHEFDPYFNFRAAQYLYDNGWNRFVNWFDYMVWYPLGRPVGTTIYPGMQVTAVWLTKVWLPIWFGVKQWFGQRFGFGGSISSRVVTKTALGVSKSLSASGSTIMSAIANLMATAGMKWNEMSLNDVCCLVPAWFGALATLTTGLLALECSSNFGYNDGNRFGTFLDDIPLLGYYLQKIVTPIRNFMAYYAGLDTTRNNATKASSLQTISLLSMLASMFFMSIVPAHIMRSIAGGFDNESVAMTAMTLVFYLWTRSLRGGDPISDVAVTDGDDNVGTKIRQKQDRGFSISPQTRSSFLFGALAGLAYFNMVAAWGGYVFVINLVGAHAATLILLGRHSSKLHAAYSGFYIVGTSLAVQVPVVGWTPIRSLEQLGPLFVFFGIQFVEYCERVRTRDNLTRSQIWLLRVRIGGLAALVGAIVIRALWPTGYFGPISSRVRGLVSSVMILTCNTAERRYAHTFLSYLYLHFHQTTN
jgi:dolichyl-diphosphooligosaccharide--protein glycosyltransferase